MVISTKEFEEFRKSMEAQIEKSVQKATAASTIAMKSAVSEAVKVQSPPFMLKYPTSSLYLRKPTKKQFLCMTAG